MKTTLRITGMTCVNCEKRISTKLRKFEGIDTLKVDYIKQTIELEYDSNIITLSDIRTIIEKLDYGTEDTLEPINKASYKNLVGALVVIIAIFLLAQQMGILAYFNFFPQAQTGMSLGMLFMIGVLTSFHCLAMCGGINLTQTLKQDSNDQGRFNQIKPSFFYNLGRVISYTIIGGIIGSLGSVVSFSEGTKGLVQLLAGVFMVIMGLNMLNVFLALRRFNLVMPKFLSGKAVTQQDKRPLFVGLLNGLMPCGPLQAMQLYALATASMFQGALAMFIFSLGTTPLMFGFGVVSTFLSRKYTKKILNVGAILVVILGISMFGNGLSLSGIGLPLTKQEVKEEFKTEIQGSMQVVSSSVSSRGYDAIKVQVGAPVKWVIKAEVGSLTGCNNTIIVPEYNIEKKLEIGDNNIEFIPTKKGTYIFTCWMGMIRSKITVV